MKNFISTGKTKSCEEFSTDQSIQHVILFLTYPPSPLPGRVVSPL